MPRELIVRVPGTWSDRNDLQRRVITHEPKGRYLFAGPVLADVQAKDHVPLDFCAADPHLARAFEVAGQGKLPARVGHHTAVVYLHFPLDCGPRHFRIGRSSSSVPRMNHALPRTDAGDAFLSHSELAFVALRR